MKSNKVSFILDGVHVTRPYDIMEILQMSEEEVIENEEECDCSLNESVNHCEGDCMRFENSQITGYVLIG